MKSWVFICLFAASGVIDVCEASGTTTIGATVAASGTTVAASGTTAAASGTTAAASGTTAAASGTTAAASATTTTTTAAASGNTTTTAAAAATNTTTTTAAASAAASGNTTTTAAAAATNTTTAAGVSAAATAKAGAAIDAQVGALNAAYAKTPAEQQASIAAVFADPTLSALMSGDVTVAATATSSTLSFDSAAISSTTVTGGNCESGNTDCMNVGGGVLCSYVVEMDKCKLKKYSEAYQQKNLCAAKIVLAAGRRLGGRSLASDTAVVSTKSATELASAKTALAASGQFNSGSIALVAGAALLMVVYA